MNQRLYSIYNTLLRHFGRQNWWPAETPFEVIVGAILTQNTSWKNVEKTIKAIKANGLMTPERLYSLSDTELADLVKPSGFYNIKAGRLKNFITFFKTFNFDLERLKQLSNIRETLLNIKGIGKETADSILLYALKLPFFVIDAYTKRIFYRLGYLKSEKMDYDEVQNLFINNLPKDINVFQEYHALIVETAKNYCKKTPSCIKCPIHSYCSYTKTINPTQKASLDSTAKVDY